MLMHSSIDRKTEGGHKYAEDKRRIAMAAEQFRGHHLATVETAMGIRGRSEYVQQLAVDTETPDSFLTHDDTLVLLLNWSLRIMGYAGEEAISASTFVERGKELVTFLSKHKEEWDAIFPTSKHLALSDDFVSEARGRLKDLLTLVGLRVRQGKKTSVLNPVSGARVRDAEIGGIQELKELLLLRACGREQRELPVGIEIVFPELAYEARTEADMLAIEWYEKQRDEVRYDVRQQMRLGRLTLAGACMMLIEREEQEGDLPF